MPRHTTIHTDLGTLTLVAEGSALSGVYFPHHWHRPDASALGLQTAHDDLLDRAATQLHEYLRGTRREFELPITTRGHRFEEQVWDQLRLIAYGERITYQDLAGRLGDRSRAWEVGQAVGRNPLSIVIPCHRVVGKNGRLTGYAGGLGRKRSLLDLEAPVAESAGRLF